MRFPSFTLLLICNIGEYRPATRRLRVVGRCSEAIKLGNAEFVNPARLEAIYSAEGNVALRPFKGERWEEEASVEYGLGRNPTIFPGNGRNPDE